jgi:hypothetical protein
MPSILETVGPRSGSAPLTYTLAETGTVDVQSIFAHFNGGGAGGTFRPMVTVRSQNGAILARGFPTDSVAAGDSADVTFAPFLRGGGASAGTGGLQFDTYPQSGGWFYAETTTDAGSPNGRGWQVKSEERVEISSTSGYVDIEADAGQVTLSSVSGSGSGFVLLDTDGSEETRGANIFSTLASGEGGEFTVRRGGGSLDAILSVYEGGDVEFYIPAAGNYVAFYGAGGSALEVRHTDNAVLMKNLPILDPGVSGQLWNNAGFVAVSP